MPSFTSTPTSERYRDAALWDRALDLDSTLHQVFQEQVRKTPDAIAAVDVNGEWTYKELDECANAIAHRLVKQGVQKDKLVAIYLEKSVVYIAACIAANKAHGGFLPLELAFPRDQLNATLKDAEATVVVTEEKRQGNIDDQPLLVLGGTDKAWYMSASAEERDAPPQLPPEQSADRESLCFVVYSSGTTGAPKGIVNPHRAPVMSYAWRFALEPYPEPVAGNVRVACNVFFIWECFRPLLKGAATVVIPDSVIYNVPELVKFLAKYKVTETLMTPSLLDTVLNMVTTGSLDNELPELQVLWLNGEVTTAALCKRAIEALPGRRIWNLYSISETHEVSALELSAWYEEHKGPTLPKYCPTGPIMPFMQVHILNEDHEPLPEGTAGEVWLSGPLLAHGYLKRPDLTAARFAPNPFHQGEIMYRTGDLGLLRDGDNLKVLARVDHIVKIRGYSVGVGVVEAALLRALRVNSVAVVADGEEGEDKRLVAYLVPAPTNADGEPTSPRARFPQAEWGISATSWNSAPIRQVLKEHLAHYMIPSLYKVVDVLPIKATSGKLDKSQLPSPPARSIVSCEPLSDEELRALPRTEACIRIWEEILQLDSGVVTADSDFFDLGGHSLTMTRTLQRMKAALGVNVAMDDFFAEPTITGCLSKDHTHERAAIDFVAEATLPSDIKPQATSSAPVQSLRECRTILLTGAAGFVGTFLLQELLSQTDARIYCLVRRKNDQLDQDRGLQDGGTRIPHTNEEARQMFSLRDSITKNFAAYRMKSTHINRVEPILGDLSKPRLGLTEPDFAKLGQEVDMIFHVGAAVNLMLPYSQLKATNVNGTMEIIRLACMRSDVRVPLHFVSTNGFLLPTSGQRITEDLDITSIGAKVTDGYSQTKLVAELLVHEAGRRGVPFSCIRPGNIAGDSGTGGTNPLDYQFLIIRAAIDLGFAPELDGWRFEMTPIDFVVNTMISIAKRPEYLGKVYHLMNTHELIPATDIFEWVAQCGYALQSEPFDAWLQRLSAHPKHGDLVAFLNVIGRGYLQQVVDTDTSHTDKVVHDYLLCRPVINSNLVALYLRYFHENGQIHTSTTEAERLVHHPLQGKVAVVTGASGGIGAAIAQGLAQAGAKVAMAARNIEKMEHVREHILRAEPGASITTVKTDVTVREQVKDLITAAEQQLGPVDILVNNAGVMYYTLMSSCEEDHWETTVDVVCKGTLHGIGAVLQGMLARNSGHIVNISSDAGRKVFPGLSVYSGAKFFVEAVSQGLRLETAATKLRVTTIQPGNVATDLAQMATDAEAVKQYGEPSGEKVLEPRDIARAVLYAVTQPEYVAVNEVLVEPSGEPA